MEKQQPPAKKPGKKQTKAGSRRKSKFKPTALSNSVEDYLEEHIGIVAQSSNKLKDAKRLIAYTMKLYSQYFGGELRKTLKDMQLDENSIDRALYELRTIETNQAEDDKVISRWMGGFEQGKKGRISIANIEEENKKGEKGNKEEENESQKIAIAEEKRVRGHILVRTILHALKHLLSLDDSESISKRSKFCLICIDIFEETVIELYPLAPNKVNKLESQVKQ